MSCSKGAVATAAHMLSERGLLDFDAPVTKYWPEFGQAGKKNVPVSYLLSHRVGLSGFEPDSGVGPRELLDWDRCTSALAAMEPLWEPGSAYMYHAVTYGYLVGEVIRRVSGKMPGKFVADEIAGPLDLELWIGLPQSQEHRVAQHFSDRPALTLEQWKQLMAGFGIDINSRVAQAMVHGLDRHRRSDPDHALARRPCRGDPGRQHDRQRGARSRACTPRPSAKWTACGCSSARRWSARASGRPTD